jgi:hypothetical protein
MALRLSQGSALPDGGVRICMPNHIGLQKQISELATGDAEKKALQDSVDKRSVVLALTQRPRPRFVDVSTLRRPGSSTRS